MTTKKFTQFDLRTPQNLNLNDYIVGYKSDGTAELRTQVRNLTAAIGNIIVGATGPVGPEGVPGYDFNYIPVTATNINLETNTGYIINTTITGPTTGALPVTPLAGHFVNFLVVSTPLSSLVISLNNSKINGLTEDLICDVSANFSLVYVDSTTGWKFIPFSGITTPVLKTYKAVLSSLDNTQYPGISGLQNIENNERIPYNYEVFNTDINTFGNIQNPGNRLLNSILIKTPGYYNININTHLYNIQDGRHCIVQIWKYTDSEGDVLLQPVADTIGTYAASPGIDQFINGSTIIYLDQPNTYIYVRLSHDVPSPGPYTSSSDTRFGGIDTGTKGPCEITITKIG